MLRTYAAGGWQVYVTNNNFIHVSIKTQTVSFETFIDKVRNKYFFSDDRLSPGEIFLQHIGDILFLYHHR
jgi:hypothetical protein